MTSSRDRADSIRIAVSSTSTCSPATVTLLTSLLLPSTGERENPKKIISKSITKDLAKGSSTATKTLKSAKATHINHNGANLAAEELSPKEKGILATETINATLKALTTPAKAPAAIRPRQSSQDLVKESARRTLRRSTSLPQSPLQTRSINRVSSSPSIATRTSRSSSTTTSGTRATAECARIAFSCLRTLQSSNTSCMSDLPPLQLENGMSVLVGKLIAVGMNDLAIKELRILKRRLDPVPIPSKKQAKAKAATNDKTSTPSLAVATLADLIHFENLPGPGPSLNLTIATQLHALNLLASSKQPALINAALPTLQYEYLGSPVQLLLQANRTSSMQNSKVAKQLDILSQVLFSLCPSISSAEDTAAIQPKSAASPEVVLRLQTLAFQCRILWWNLAGHRGDVEKEILDPFSKCLAGFARRSQCEATATYEYALGALQMIQEAVASYDKTSTKATGPSAAGMYKIVGSLAQEARLFNDAIEWIGKVQSSHNSSTSDAQRCAVSATLLGMKLMMSPADATVEELVNKTLEGICGPLKGSSQDLDVLLTEVSHARRAAISILSSQKPEPCSSTKDVMSNRTRERCESFILQCPRFTLRFLGSNPGPNVATKLIVRYEQRRQFVIKSAFNTIDSALYLIKTFQSGNRLTWDLMDSTLQDCLALLEAVGDGSTTVTEESKDAATSYFVRISGLYYKEHLNMRRDVKDAMDVENLRPLRRSIDCVRNRSRSEKRASILFSKLERLADIHRSMGHLDSTRESLIFLRDELVDSGVLSTVATAAGSKPLQDAWELDDSTAMLGRVCALILKIELKLKFKGSDLSFCSAGWSKEEKGAVLEHSLDILSKPSKEVFVVQRSIVDQLLALYDHKQYPVRRLRTTIRLLRLDFDQRRDLTVEVKSTLALSGLENLIMESRDSQLQLYVPHLQALALTILELQEDHPRIDLLKPHLTTWGSILEDCKDYESLSSKIDDVPDLVNHLHSIADFLHMKGFCSIRLPVLRIITNINEIHRPKMSADDLPLNYSALALQYLELGYSGKAGLVLDKAQSLAKNNGVALQTSLRVHLSYAQYLIAIGSSEKW
jgi:separase